jgi:hypothetical protein
VQAAVVTGTQQLHNLSVLELLIAAVAAVAVVLVQTMRAVLELLL